MTPALRQVSLKIGSLAANDRTRVRAVHAPRKYCHCAPFRLEREKMPPSERSALAISCHRSMLALAPGLTRVTLPRVVVARGNDLPSYNLSNRRCDVLRVGIACLPKRSGRRRQARDDPAFLRPRFQTLERICASHSRGTGTADPVAS